MIDRCGNCGITGQIDIIRFQASLSNEVFTIAKCKNCGVSKYFNGEEMTEECEHLVLEPVYIGKGDSTAVSFYECKNCGSVFDKNSTVSKVYKGEYKAEIKMGNRTGDTDKKVDALSHQVGGGHYKDYKIQPYEFFMANAIPHHKAAIIRRILRYDHPTGKGKEDLMKIKHEIELILQLDPIFKEKE